MAGRMLSTAGPIAEKPSSMSSERTESEEASSDNPCMRFGYAILALARKWASHLTWSKLKFFYKHTMQESKRYRCNTCLGVCSCLIVVLISALCYTLVRQAPAIFYAQAEQQYGQYDCLLEPSETVFLNYTKMAELSETLTESDFSTSGSQGSTYRFDLNTPRFLFNDSRLAVFDSDCYDWVASNLTDDSSGSNIPSGTRYEPYNDGCEVWTRLNQTSDNEDSNEVCRDNTQVDLTLWALDFARERRMDFGRDFDHSTTPVRQEALISRKLSSQMDLESGDSFLLRLPLTTADGLEPWFSSILVDYPLSFANTVRDYYDEAEERSENSTLSELLRLVNYECTQVLLPLKVKAIAHKSAGGKFGKGQFDVLVSYEHLMEVLIPSLPSEVLSLLNVSDSLLSYPLISDSSETSDGSSDSEDSGEDSINDSQEWSSEEWTSKLYQFANRVYYNIGGDRKRLSVYIQTDFQNVQDWIIGYSSSLIYYLGFTELDLSLDVMTDLGANANTILSLNVVLDIIIFVLVLLSCMLLYSLMIIAIDRKIYDLGIFRMLGMSRTTLLHLCISQSLLYSIPAYGVGLLIAQGLAVVLLDYMGDTSAGQYDLPKELTSEAITLATIVGFGSALGASVLPIRSVLALNIQESLDTRRGSKTAGVQWQISSGNDATDSANDEDGGFKVPGFNWSIFCVGLTLVCFGWAIFYFLPQSFINNDLSLMAIMLLSLMLAMLTGLILIIYNFQQIIERLFVTLTLSWWESPPIPQLVLNNLISHRQRNQKTTLMYSLSLAFILFVSVMISSNLSLLEMANLRSTGTYMFCWTDNGNAELEAWLETQPMIEDFTIKYSPVWGTQHTNEEDIDWTYYQNIGRYFDNWGWHYPVPPNFDNVVVNKFIKPNTVKHLAGNGQLTYTEQLHTAMGSQRILMGYYAAQEMNLDNLDDEFITVDMSGDENYVRKWRSLGWMNLYSFLSMTQRTYEVQDLAISSTSMMRLFKGIDSLEDLKHNAVMVRFSENALASDKNELKNELLKDDRCSDVIDYRTIQKDVESANEMLNFLFEATTYTALFLCLFSLIASVWTNILQQSKEIGILRSLGLTNFAVMKLFLYESLMLVLSSSFLGVCVGIVMALVVVAQQSLFSSFPLTLTVPASVILSVVTGSIISALVSVYIPIQRLSKSTIATVIRSQIF